MNPRHELALAIALLRQIRKDCNSGSIDHNIFTLDALDQFLNRHPPRRATADPAARESLSAWQVCQQRERRSMTGYQVTFKSLWRWTFGRNPIVLNRRPALNRRADHTLRRVLMHRCGVCAEGEAVKTKVEKVARAIFNADKKIRQKNGIYQGYVDFDGLPETPRACLMDFSRWCIKKGLKL